MTDARLEIIERGCRPGRSRELAGRRPARLTARQAEQGVQGFAPQLDGRFGACLIDPRLLARRTIARDREVGRVARGVHALAQGRGNVGRFESSAPELGDLLCGDEIAERHLGPRRELEGRRSLVRARRRGRHAQRPGGAAR